MFGYRSDIYQVGLILFQLLGGSLPYDPYAWLSKREAKEAEAIVDEAERSLFIDRCLESRISKGKIANVKDLPIWVSKPLRNIVRKAISVNPDKRYDSVADFIAAINNATPNIFSWRLSGGALYLDAETSYRVTEKAGGFSVSKRRGESWRNDNSFSGGEDLSAVISAIESRS